MRVRSSLLVISAFVGLWATGCAPTTADDAEGSGSDLVVGTDALTNSVTVASDRLTFDPDVVDGFRTNGLLDKIDAYAKAEAKKSAEPVILVAGRGDGAVKADGTVDEDARNPDGYLRRALSYEIQSDGHLVIMTEDSNIEEAAAELEKAGMLKLDAPTLEPQSETDDAPKSIAIDESIDFGLVDRTGATLLSYKDTKVGLTVRLKSGQLNIRSHVTGSFTSDQSATKEGALYVSAGIDGSLEFEVTATGTALSLTQGGSLLPYPIKKAVLVGGIPMTVSLALDWKCGVQIEDTLTLTLGAKASATLEDVGATWQGKTFSPVLNTPTFSFEPIGPTMTHSAHVGARCDILPTVKVMLFDLLGPQAAVDMYASADASMKSTDSADLSLTAGATLTLGGGLEPFGYKVASWNAKPLTYGPIALAKTTVALDGTSSGDGALDAPTDDGTDDGGNDGSTPDDPPADDDSSP